AVGEGVPSHEWDYLYEPDAGSVLEHVLTRYIESLVYQAVLEKVASEHASRMGAMNAASDNATKMIGTLSLVYNNARQAAITQEISEIVGGAAAVCSTPIGSPAPARGPAEKTFGAPVARKLKSLTESP